MAESETKRCSRCGEDKPRSKFHRRKNRPDGHASACKECHGRSYYDVDVWRERRFRRVYGISLAEYDSMWEAQEGKCYLCGGVSNGRGRLAVDHDHDTGYVRGLLCFTCNTLIGTVERLGVDRIAAYLERGRVSQGRRAHRQLELGGRT